MLVVKKSLGGCYEVNRFLVSFFRQVGSIVVFVEMPRMCSFAHVLYYSVAIFTCIYC